MIETKKGQTLDLESTLTETQQIYKSGARNIYRAIAEAMGPFQANDSTQHAHYSRAADLIEATLLPKPPKLKAGEKPKPKNLAALPNLRDRAKWEQAIEKAIKAAPAKDLEIAREEALRVKEREAQAEAKKAKAKKDAAAKKKADAKKKPEPKGDSEESDG